MGPREGVQSVSQIRKVNLTSAETLAHISSHVEANRDYYSGGLVVRCVSVLQDGVWRNAVCFVRAQPAGNQLPATKSRRYETVHLLEERADLSLFTRLVRELPTGSATIDGETVFVGQNAEFRGWQLEPSTNDYSDLSGYLYQTSQSSSVYPASLQEPLLKFSLPTYANGYSAIPGWVGLRRFNQLSDARVGYLWLFLSECRATLSKIERSEDRLRVAIARGARESNRRFHLQGTWETPRGPSSFTLATDTVPVETEIPEGATSLSLYLLDETDKTFDYHLEGQNWSPGQERIFPSSQEEDTEMGDGLLPQASFTAPDSFQYHAEIEKVSRKLYADGHYKQAVLEAYIRVISAVKERSGLDTLDGDKLMNKAFGCDKQPPVIRFNSLRTQEEMDEQTGFLYLFKGVVALRNSKAHSNRLIDDPKRAHEYLAQASLLMRLLDLVKVNLP
jgi:uncharacterized protein (TIGR02391 family)